MKYVAKELEGNVNVSETHPLAELAWLLGGVVLIIAVVYLLLGLATDYAAEHMPIEAETWLGEKGVMEYGAAESEVLRRRLDPLLAALPGDSPLKKYRFRVHLVESSDVNAVALPGGQILVFSELVNQTASENELMMVLAHEIGHYAHRDHLRGLGRGLGVALATMLIFGEESGVSNLVRDVSMRFEARYSQAQEAAADAFAVDLLVASQGHAGGATDFFDRLDEQRGAAKFVYLFASHPHPADRVKKIRQRIADAGYAVLATEPLRQDLVLKEDAPD